VFWYIAVILEMVLCGWVQLERRAIRRRGDAARGGAIPPLHRSYGRVLGRIKLAVERRERAEPRLERIEARRRTGLVTFGLITAAMVPMFLFVVFDGFEMNPVVGQLVGWSLLWLSPVLTFAPARLIALLVAVWRGWLRLDDGDGGISAAASPVPGSGPDSHHFVLPR
jgi:hypothetical protein